jgi:hypothetical protein
LKTFREISKEELPQRSSEFKITLYQEENILKCGGEKTMKNASS